ncbi:UTP--glucose-1-phosphate uridylyltransferase [Rickettsiales bacterium]|nr:UTP--glucose-1-phosphate uridylyltransferase [Rickettsiales bacterium]
MTIKTAIFPVGGFGTRFLPATKSMPKEMLPVANKPIIQYAFEEAKAAGVERFIFITGRNKNIINNHFDKSYELEDNLDQKRKNQELKSVSNWLPSEPGAISFIRQGAPLGLGHSIWCARNFVKNEPFIVILADEMIYEKESGSFLKGMIDFYNKKQEKCNIISVAQIPNDDTDKYGIISCKEDRIIDMVEKPNPKDAPSNLAINGRYILQPEIFDYLEKKKIGAGNEIQLTDAMKEMSSKSSFYYQKYYGERFDCGNVTGYIEANIAFAMKNPDLKDNILPIIKKYI